MKKKKLMILNGHWYLLPVIRKAHELGIYVITVDYRPENIAHQYSDEYHNVSVIDKEAVLELAKKLEIDGIISYANDAGVETAAYVAEQMGLNFQCPYESTRILQDKGKFRKFLEENGFNSPHSQWYTSKTIPQEDIEYFNWPVIVKPVDSCGSHGVSRIETPEELPEAIKTALRYSRSGAYIIEDFLTFKGNHHDFDSFTINGKLTFNVYSDQFFDPETGNPFAPAQLIWPSLIEEEYQKELDSELQRLMDLLHMKHGIYNVETCVGEDGKTYIMEVSPRGGGGRLAELEKCAYGIDLIEYEVRQAVNLPLKEMGEIRCDGVWSEYDIFPKKTQRGSFIGIEIAPDVREKYLKFIDVLVKPGEYIDVPAGHNPLLANIFLRCDDRQQMDELYENVDHWLKIVVK